MNWLAHLRLAPDQPVVRIGNLAGDFVRGIDISTLHPDLQRGIIQHREIDAFVDAHKIVQRARARFDERCRRFGGVALDVFFDHYLARDWHLYGDGRQLTDFVADVHESLATYRELLPQDLQRLHERMAQNSWLTMYGSIGGIAQVLRAMAQRSRRSSALATIASELQRNYDAFDADFAELWPELVDFASLRHAT